MLLIPSQFKRSSRAIGRCVLAVAMCVLLLQLPVPVLHQHDDFASSEALLGHLDRHHPVAAPDLCCSDDLCRIDDLNHKDPHWHLVLPSQLGHESQPEDKIPSPFDVFAFASSGTHVAVGSQVDSFQSFVGAPSLLISVLLPAPEACHLLQRVGHPPCHLPTRALLCVMRC